MEPAPIKKKRNGSTALTVAGVLVALVAGALVAAGGAGLWATGTSDGGFVSSGAHRFAAPTHAIVSDGLKVDSGVPDWLIGRARVEASGADGKRVFLGVARKRDVDAYLAQVSRSEIRNLDYSPFRLALETRAGTTSPARPATQTFWAASTSGAGLQRLTWRIRSGEWRVVLMNADASPGVTADVTVGGRVGHPFAIGIGIVGGGLLLGLLAGLLIYAGRAVRVRPHVAVTA